MTHALFTCDLVHVPGPENAMADALSRPYSPAPASAFTWATVPPPAPAIDPLLFLFATSLDLSTSGFDFSTLPALQSACPSIQSMLSSQSLFVISVLFLKSSVLCDVSSGSPLLGLFGLNWPKMGLWARSSLQCQQSKVQTHVRSPVPQIPVLERRVSHVHLDLVGPFPSSQGFTYLLTMIDRTLQWPEVVSLTNITAETCARTLIGTWISRFGVPALLTTDRGSQFMSMMWTEVCSVLRCSPVQTTWFHPQSNGIIERFHCSLKSVPRARLASVDSVQHLPLVLLGLQSALRDDSSYSPEEAVYGSTLSLPGEFLGLPKFPLKVFL